MDSLFESKVEAFCRSTSDIVGSEYFRTRKLEFELLRMLARSFASNRFTNVLELGCGIGFKALLMSQYVAHIDAVDIDTAYHGFKSSKKSSDIARAAFENIGIKNIDIFSTDYAKFLNEHVNTYELIYSDYLLEHIPNITELCRYMYLGLVPGGKMLHIVPNTHDALIQFSKENLQPFLVAMARVMKGYFNSAFGSLRRRPKRMFNGVFVPITHSEFIHDYAQQFEVYRIENYLFPMIEAGFEIVQILPLREHSCAIFAQKPAMR
ncbi:MAG: hypothetical protein COS99_06975 [Candidatus Omnitrophica bacterium CG07_land_8_20_14_0_80_42_15]|uniref:Methyltransferase domain-containing protein n=1 Tax=Candidatus Aquitaenariimonas noxiae TaxID=1974741 RepID=A0A2J0KZ15_9BACT|nr:MAG: hypothetical protein COS99_06975 [Candidatus Omnitrophica bacterium CG07_land_8_20_14_0_80_42_15]